MGVLTGLSAFPITPVAGDAVDEDAASALVARAASAGVDSIGALGSTGGSVYLTRAQRRRVARLAVEAAGTTPVIVGIGALTTRDVLAAAADAQEIGAAAVLLAPVSYQRLTDEEVFGLYDDVTRELSVPLCVYDNPTTTGFTFSDELHARIARLPGVAAVKVPSVPADPALARGRLDRLRSLLPAHVEVAVSGDATAATGLLCGAAGWCSVLAGVLPVICREITDAALAGEPRASALSDRLAPVWSLVARFGSLRVVCAVAEELGLVRHPNLPAPLRGLDAAARTEVADVVRALDLADRPPTPP